jgi:hypothetical protein
MPVKLILFALLVSGCVDGSRVEPDRRTIEHSIAIDGTRACDLLPEEEGPCSVACDPDAVQDYILAGTCAVFACELADGSTIHIGGCRE